MANEMTLAVEIARRLSGSTQFLGDPHVLEMGIHDALAESPDSDPVLSIAFQPMNAKSFADEVSRLGTESKQSAHVARSQVAPISRKDANAFLLYRNLPGGIARVKLSFLEVLLKAGVIKSFSWEPKIKLAD